MEVTYGELISYQEPFNRLINLELPANVGVRVAKLARIIINELKPALDQNNKLIDKYGKKIKGRLTILQTDKNWIIYQKEYSELCAVTTTIDDIKIKLPADIKISVDILLALDKFIEVDEE